MNGSDDISELARQPDRVVVGVSGGIAAYKAAEVVRQLIKRGHRVQVVMTRAATEFIQPLTFAALTGEKVVTELFDTTSATATLDSSVEHIGVAQQTRLLVIAPATADLLAKLAHGLAGDFLTTMALAYTGPVLVAPAMNTNMWAHPATQANVATLRERGVHFVEPDAGDLACGMVGPGRLAEPEVIADAAERLLAPVRDLAGERILITAGPTREPIDPVRYIGNRSSGRMGYALARAALERGACVDLISGPTDLPAPAGADLAHVETAGEMLAAVSERWPQATIGIFAAAVADYRVEAQSAEKIKKNGTGARSLALVENPDILAEAVRTRHEQIVVGFAAETNDVLANARSKLERKGCDMIVANPVGTVAQGTGIGADFNQGWILTPADEPTRLDPTSKGQFADAILDAVRRVRVSQPAP